jgi:putative transposase
MKQVQSFRERSLAGEPYPVRWVDALYEKVRYGDRVVSMAPQIVCVVNAQGRREALVVKPMLEESKATYQQLYDSLKVRGLRPPSLVVSDVYAGLVNAIRQSFPGASWQRCKVHFMRNILAHVSHREKGAFTK